MSLHTKIPFVWWRRPNTAALIPSKISPDHKENLTHFRHSARSESVDGSSSPRACLYSRLWAKKKKNLYASCFSIQTHTRCSSRSHCHYRWQHHPMGVSSTEEGWHPGLRGVWEAGGGLFELYGFMDGWIHGCERKRMHGWILRRGMTMEWEGKACRICRKWAHGALGWTLHRLVGNY